MQSLLASIHAKKSPIAVVGLGYVGLPLAALLARKFRVIGFDISVPRIEELSRGFDHNREVENQGELVNPNIKFTADAGDLSLCQLIIVAVPTPVDEFKKPDLSPLISAARTVGKAMKPGAVVVFESTVYPGLTESVCRSELEEASGLKYGSEFFLGYSPERVNPGDRTHSIDRIVKVVAGSTPEVGRLLVEVYGTVVTAGIHYAPSIAVAEAAKVIENTQRDINIALINELAMLFEKIGIDTQDVLAASRTKWNFLDFRPGLVGGHCIGVDPYYLTHLAEGVGIHPQVIIAGRHINDGMGKFVAQKTMSMLLSAQSYPLKRPRIAIFGATFKENVPDIRNTKVIDVVVSLESFGAEVLIVDPVADAMEFEREFGRQLVSWEKIDQCDAAILAVTHRLFLEELSINWLAERLRKPKIVVDIKGILNREHAKEAGLSLWRL